MSLGTLAPKKYCERGLSPRPSPDFHGERHLGREWKSARLYHQQIVAPCEQYEGLTVNHRFASLGFAQETAVERKGIPCQPRQAQTRDESGAHSYFDFKRDAFADIDLALRHVQFHVRRTVVRQMNPLGDGSARKNGRRCRRTGASRPGRSRAAGRRINLQHQRL
jgi:hypothetical protein